MSRFSKVERRSKLIGIIERDPFLTDEELASALDVSVPTIRLDRTVLGIDELRKRLKKVAKSNIDKVTSIVKDDIRGELIEFVPNTYAATVMNTDLSMVFEKSKIVRGEYLYSMAETVAMAVIDASSALVKIANIKYKQAVYENTSLLAKADLRRKIDNLYTVWVKIYSENTEIFRGKFILESADGEN